MFSKGKTTLTAKFYNEPTKEELYTGYLHKSPFLSGLTKGMKSWRRRFFVLSKMGEDTYQLAYYRNDEKRDKPSREIDLSKVSLICTCPEKHPMWDWIQRNFKCSPSSVLLLRVEDFVPKCARDYFLIGENSEGVDRLHNELLNIFKTKISQNTVRVTDECQNRLRSISEPIPQSQNCEEVPSETDHQVCRHSAPVALCLFTSQPLKDGHYDVPAKFRDECTAMAANKNVVSNDDDDDNEEQPETPADNSEYMAMASLRLVLQQNPQEEDACVQTNTSTNGLESCQDVCNAADNQDKDNPMKRKTHTPIEKDICVNRNDLNRDLIFTQKEGKPCVSECKKIEASCMLHRGDQIVAVNDLLIETVEEMQTYLRRSSKDEVKLTFLRHLESQPFNAESCSH